MIDDQAQCSYNSIVTMEEEIVDVNVKLNQDVTQQFSRTTSGIALNFHRLG